MPRPKGSKNKVTNDVRGVLSAILERNTPLTSFVTLFLLPFGLGIV